MIYPKPYSIYLKGTITILSVCAMTLTSIILSSFILAMTFTVVPLNRGAGPQKTILVKRTPNSADPHPLFVDVTYRLT